ncbi:hypothetical protein QWZ02_15350 [Kinneretia asaccharophila]|uniref:hypothetical protein n=1 Tax=Roseateles asaccharophilus TaxID=582607 RepID=UPI0010613BCB|nr:hypothetical protein [Roseateles asaccharophilus]MDN3545832.1 hypothetical protein [Roseateles asaccharophilus]
MRALDLDAEILRGDSAAGFELGMHVSEVDDIVNSAASLHRRPSVAELQANSGVLVVRNSFNAVTTVFFGDDQVRLAFNAEGRLFCIFLFKGYRGAYRQSIRIGTPLRLANAEHLLLFDEGDEMSYIDDGSGEILPGIAFIGRCSPLEADPDQPIFGFCVHDWSKQ